jgi:Zn-dependent peptidase ImmA (M78 family)
MTTEGLTFELRPPRPRHGEELLTTASLLVRVGGEPIWPVDGVEDAVVEIQIDDLLSHFTEFWKPLALRQTYPTRTVPDRPTALRVEAERQWDSNSLAAEWEDGEIASFEEAHDLSRCFAGYYDLPPIWLLRSGDRMIVDSRAGLKVVQFDQAWREISRLGDEIVLRLARRPDRWSALIKAWGDRDLGEPELLLAWVTSLDRSVAGEFVKEGLLTVPRSVSEAANDDDELRIAARMASALDTDQIRQILSALRTFDRNSAPQLDDLGRRVTEYVSKRFAADRAHVQGEAAAVFVRDEFELSSTAAVDIRALLNELGVTTYPRSVDPPTLDAVAVWGNVYGPGILLNQLSSRVRGADSVGGEVASRVTLSHELCHLLLDRGHALGAVDVLNGRMPPDIEKRAKSFAGELLLPASAAYERWRSDGEPRERHAVERLIDRLRKAFRVPKSVAAWKLEHGLQRNNVDLSRLLDTIVPHR